MRSQFLQRIISALLAAPLLLSGCTTEWQTDEAVANKWLIRDFAKAIGSSGYQLTQWDSGRPTGSIVWPNPISTDNFQLSFTVTMSNTSPLPADGFAVVFGDPTLGAMASSKGATGVGLGAMGIPGIAITFDDYQNGPDYIPGFPGDPPVPYIGITRSETTQFERPFFAVTSSIPALAAYGQSVTHDCVITYTNGSLTVVMDGNPVLTGQATLPPVAYLYITSTTGLSWEQTSITNLRTKNLQTFHQQID